MMARHNKKSCRVNSCRVSGGEKVSFSKIDFKTLFPPIETTKYKRVTVSLKRFDEGLVALLLFLYDTISSGLQSKSGYILCKWMSTSAS